MTVEDLAKVQSLLNQGLSLDLVAKQMGYRSYHTFRVRMLESSATIQYCVVDVKTRRPLHLLEEPENADKS